MPYTEVHICNRALSKVGDKRIMSLDDPSDTAAVLKNVYTQVLEAEISSYRWSFAMARAVLPALAEAPVFGYERAFMLPADFLRLLEVGLSWPSPSRGLYQSGPNAAWEVEGGKILTNYAAPLHIRYLRSVTDPALFPPVFVSAFSAKLAIEICERIAGGTSRRELLWKEYDLEVKNARRVNAIQRAPRFAQDGSWMRARRLPGSEEYRG